MGDVGSRGGAQGPSLPEFTPRLSRGNRQRAPPAA
jgi:hypothetical protein